MTANKLVLVDGNALVYRAFFAIPPHLRTRSGLHTNAIFGFVSMFRKLNAKRPSHGAVVMDAPGKTKRDEMYADYKAQRAPMPPELAAQLPYIDRAVQVHGYPLLRVPGVEADDVIGTLAKQGRARGMEVLIVSSDKDFTQLMDEHVRMIDTIKDVTYDRELVRKKWGVWPEQIIDLLALMGDSSDNIPGVAGIGQKGATQLLADFASLSSLLEEAAKASDHDPRMPSRARKALIAGADDARLSQKLATIDCAVDMPTQVGDLALPAVDVGVQQAFFAEMEFFSLLDHAAKQSAKKVQQQEDASGAATDRWTSVAQALPHVDTLHKHTVAVLPMLEGVHAPHARLLGCVLAFADGATKRSVVVDAAAFPALVPWLQHPEAKKVVHDAKGLEGLWWRMGVRMRGVVHDTQVASFLVDPTKIIPHVFDEVVKEYLQRGVPSLKDIAAADEATQSSHWCERAAALLDLHPQLMTKLEERAQLHVMNTLELPLRAALVDMEHVGIAVDAAHIEHLDAQWRARLQQEEAEVHRLAGRAFNIGSPKQLGEVLFDELKLPVIKKTKTGYSTDAEVLERLEKKHPIARAILAYRKTDKLLNTTIDVLQEERRRHADARVRACFQQTASATGRLITSEPDLQRTPIRSADGGHVRRCFIATPHTERVLVDADWSQIELRLLAHFSGDALLLDAFATGADVHKRTAAQIFSVAEDDVTKAQREVGKTVNFATIYGQGASALAQQLDIERAQALKYIDAYFHTYAGVKQFAEEAVRTAERDGYASTLLGRRRIIPELASKSPMDRSFGERVAVNTPIQGSAADICKMVMVQLHAWLRESFPRAHLLLQIHDELVVECEPHEVNAVAAKMKQLMEGVVQLRVPLLAEVGVGKSWGEAKDNTWQPPTT
jgi:DNA polymerase I